MQRGVWRQGGSVHGPGARSPSRPPRPARAPDAALGPGGGAEGSEPDDAGEPGGDGGPALVAKIGIRDGWVSREARGEGGTRVSRVADLFVVLHPYSHTEVSIHQLEKERAVIMDMIALCPVLFPEDAQASKKQAPAKPFHLPRSVKSAPPGHEACHFFSLTDEMARRTAPLSMRTAEEGIDGEHHASASVTLKPPPKPLGRPPDPLLTGSSSRQEHCLKMDHGRNRSHVNQGNMASGHVMDCAMNREEIRRKDLATAPEVWKVSTGLPSFPEISPQHPPAKPSRSTPQ